MLSFRKDTPAPSLSSAGGLANWEKQAVNSLTIAEGHQQAALVRAHTDTHTEWAQGLCVDH